MKTTTCRAIFQPGGREYDYYVDLALDPKPGDLGIVPSGFSSFGFALVQLVSVDTTQRSLNELYEYKTITQTVKKE